MWDMSRLGGSIYLENSMATSKKLLTELPHDLKIYFFAYIQGQKKTLFEKYTLYFNVLQHY